MAKKSNAKIRLIQCMIREHGLKEPEYRQIYESATGVDGLTKMKSDKDLDRVIVAMRRALNIEATPKNRGTTLCREPWARKIRSLWLTLRDLGVLEDSSEKALLAFIHTRTGRERMEWLHPAQQQHIIEQLKHWVARIQADRATA